MKRDDLKEKLDGKSLDEVFLKHRPGIDQPGYRVGKVGEEVVVLNESSGEIMDYFYDDVPDKEWFSLSLYKPEYSGCEINKNTGRVRNTKTGMVLAVSIHNSGYHSAKTHIKGKHVGFYIHSCLGHIFIPNLDPDINCIVDHLDRNRLNNSLNNLRWIDAKTSRENQNRNKDKYRYQYFAYSDKEMNTLVYKFDCVEDIMSTLAGLKTTKRNSVVGSISNCIRTSATYHGYYWKKESVSLKQYLEHLGYSLSDVNLSDFIYNPVYKVKVNIKLGIIINKNSVISCGGTKIGKYYYTGLILSHKEKPRIVPMSYIIWSTANGCIPVPKGKEVDHINSDSLDNRAENLQLVDSHSDNMKNPNTQAKIKAAKEAKKTQKN